MKPDYMPRGPNVAIRLCIVSSAKQDLSYFCTNEDKCVQLCGKVVEQACVSNGV